MGLEIEESSFELLVNSALLLAILLTVFFENKVVLIFLFYKYKTPASFWRCFQKFVQLYSVHTPTPHNNRLPKILALY